MREFGVCLVLVLFVGILIVVSGNPVGDDGLVALEAAEQPLSLFDVNADMQGHENEGDRLARHHHGYGGNGGYRGGYHGGYGHGGGYGGGYGGHRGGHRGGYYG